ncbi:MAG: hypothetical protein ACFFD2_13935 [Promethearchaeota archaeon]
MTIRPILNITNTYKKTFFISFNSSMTAYWLNIEDIDSDDGLVYRKGFEETWNYDTTDFTLRLFLSPIQTQMNPSQINMTINSKLVSNSRRWNSSEFRIPQLSGLISFNISSTWYNISYQINWTNHLLKIDKGVTSYFAEPMNDVVQWNVTVSAFFATGSYNKIINVTIPATWNATHVYYNSIEHDNSSWEEILGNSKKSVIILQADNGTWVITCDGFNWISDLTISKAILYTLDTVTITAHLISSVYDSNDTAQVYVMDPYQQVLANLAGRGFGDFINISWFIGQSIHINGDYQITLSWFNGTEAGIWNTSIQVYNSTSIIIVNPMHRGTIIETVKGQIFNLTLYYNMSYWEGSYWGTLYLNNTMDANLTYIFQGSAPQPMDLTSLGGNWAWTTPITSPNSYGTYPIYINATAWGNIQNYTNYLILLQVKQYGTNLIFNDTAKETFWSTPIAFSFTYTNLTGHSIETDNITINWKYNYDSAYRGLLYEWQNYSVTYNIGTGVYTILFDNFSAHIYKLLFHIEGDIYQSQEAYLTLQFNNRTTSLTNQTIIPRPIFQEVSVVNVTVYYQDLVVTIGISGGIITSNWSTIKDYSVQDLGNGYYNVSLNLSSVTLNNYSILISASKNNYKTANLVILLEIYGYPTNISAVIAENLTGSYAIIYAMENWTVSFEYTNLSNRVGISGAIIYANLNGESCIWLNTIGGNYTVWVDTSKLSLPMAGQNYTLQILIGKAFYEEQSVIITVNITKLPSQLYPKKSMIYAEIDDFIEMQVQFNDSYNQQGIIGTIWYELQGITKQMLPTGMEGLYSATINLTDYVPGEYQINLNSWAIDYRNASYSIILNVSRLNIFIIAESPTIVGYINEILNVSVQLKDSKNRIVENLLISYEIPSKLINGSFIYNYNGFYNASIALNGFDAGLYQLKISSSLTIKYNKSITILNLEVSQIPTIIIASNMNITAYYGEQYLLSVSFLNIYNGSLIDNEDLRYEIAEKIPLTPLTSVGLGNYQTTLNTTNIGIGDYIIEIKTGILTVLYHDSNLSIEFHIVSQIQTELNIEMSTKIRVGNTLNITFKLQTLSSIPITNHEISYSIITQFYNSSSSQFDQSFSTNQLGMVFIQYLVPVGAKTINVIASFAGTSNLTAVWNTSDIVVQKIAYNLDVRVDSHVSVGQNLLIQADLSNETHLIANALINFTIFIVFSDDIMNISYISGYTNSNGTVSVYYLVPDGTISLYIVATYRGGDGAVTSSNPQIVITLDPWVFWLQQWGMLVGLIILSMVLSIFFAVVYIKYLRPKFMSIERKKRGLIKRRAINRREIEVIEQQIKKVRSETLKEAETAKNNMNFFKAAKLYKKAGNLTLELADKSIAREFFSKAKQMEKQLDQKQKRKDLEERRKKFLEKARISIRQRKVIEASRNYREVAEISRMLGERKQAEKFLKLANAASERIESLKEGDLRKKSGEFLSKADKAMGNQNFIKAAENFEESAKIMALLGEDEGIARFVSWAKLAREKDILVNSKPKDVWIKDLNQNIKSLIGKAKKSIIEKKFEEAINDYTSMLVYATELGLEEDVEKFKKHIEFCRNQVSLKKISPEMRSLINERKKLLARVEEAINIDRFATIAKYYKRIAAISEIIDGKEVANSYMKKAKHYLNKLQERRVTEVVKQEEIEMRRPPKKQIMIISEDEIEEMRAKLAITVKNARNALKSGKNLLARELYTKASILARLLKEKESERRYKQKAEEIKLFKPEKLIENKAVIRRNISDLMQKVEKALQKKKYTDAKNLYEDISQLFIQLGEDDAANEFLERANSVNRLIKK